MVTNALSLLVSGCGEVIEGLALTRQKHIADIDPVSL